MINPSKIVVDNVRLSRPIRSGRCVRIGFERVTGARVYVSPHDGPSAYVVEAGGEVELLVRPDCAERAFLAALNDLRRRAASVHR